MSGAEPSPDGNPQRPAPGPTPTGYQRTQGGGFKWVPPTPERLSQMLPQYEIEALVGRGGMGAVYRGRQKALDRPVAIKILPPEVDDEDASYTLRFKNEAKIMAKLDHPAIVPVYDFGETGEGQLYFVMSFINGTDVHQMIQQQGRLPPEHALAITAHVCDALKYAHDHGVVHRDIKPSNVLINMEGQVKVADFGLAKVDDPSQSSGLTKTGLAMGTPDYVAPETLTLGMTVDGRADLYAVGVMLYQMLTGNVPRGAFKPASVMIPGIDPRFDLIATKAMQHDRDERYQTAAEIRRDLDVILTTPMVQHGGKASAAIPKQSLAQKPVAKGPQKPMGKSANVPVRQEAAAAAAPNHQSPVVDHKSKAPLFIGLGAAAAIAVGAFVVMGGKKEAQPKVGQAAGLPESSIATQRVAPPSSAAPIKVREEPKVGQASSLPKAATKMVAPPSAPAAAPISNLKSPISNPATAAFPPGKWVKVYTKAEDLPAELRKPDSGVKFEDGWIRFGGQQRTLKVQTTPVRNFGIKLRALKSADDAAYARIALRAGSDLATWYQGGTWGAGSGTLALQRWNKVGDKETLKARRISAPNANEIYALEVGVVGSRVIGRFNDTTLSVGSDDALHTGTAHIYGAEDIRDIEVINLDGLSEAEALKIVGVDEKGNDLRQSATVAATSRAPSVSKSPPLPVSASSPKFAPGQWVKLFTKFEDLPEDLRKPDSGVKFGDGWLKSVKRINLPSLGPPTVTNLGLRVTFKGVDKDAAGFLATIGLRYDDVDSSSVLSLRQYSHSIQLARIGLVTKKHPVRPSDLILHTERIFSPVDRSWAIEFAVVGKSLIGRVDGKLMPVVESGKPEQGRMPGSVISANSIRDIEVINLDGLPEAEALRILGVDEKGNDLRALAAKQAEQQKAQAQQVDAIGAIPELKTLHEQLVKLQAERVAAPFATDVAALNTSYLGGLDREIEKEKKAGRLDGVIALEAEKKLIAVAGVTDPGTPGSMSRATAMRIPAEDDDTTPANLKGLRQIYRTAFAKLEATRAANLKLLTDPLSLRLKQLESTLTQKNRVPDAKLVREYREGLGQSGPFSPLSGTSVPVPSGTAQGTVRATKKFPPGDDRKAAEWVLSVGGGVQIRMGNQYTTIRDTADLPRGKFDLFQVFLEFRNTAPKAPCTDLAPLAGLRELRNLQLSTAPLGDAAFEVVPSLPGLAVFRAENLDLSDAVFAHFASANLSSLVIHSSKQIIGEKIRALSQSKALTSLTLQGCGLTEAGLREIARLPALTLLNVGYSPVSDAELPQLSALTKLVDFSARKTGISVSALASMQAWRDLRKLDLDIKPGEMAAGCERLSQAFPKVEAFGFHGLDDWNYTADDLRGLKAFPKLSNLTIWNTKLRDEAVDGLLDLDKLDTLRLDGCSLLTDAALETLSRHKRLDELLMMSLQIDGASLTHLAKLRSLKKLEIRSCPNLTGAAIAAFEKARPDVKVTR